MTTTHTPNEPAAVEPSHTRKGGKRRAALAGVAAVLIFLFGLNVGNGRISLGFGNNTTQLPGRLDYSSVNETYNTLKANYYGKLTGEQLLDGMKKGMAEATGDPYTQYFTAKEAEEFERELNNSYSGVGIQLGKDESGNLEVIAPVKDTPADKAGVLAKDIVAFIDGKSTEGLAVDAAVNRIRGEAGTQVKLGLVRNKSQTLELTITRESFTVPSVESKILPGNLGYMQINSFAPDTAELAQQAAQKFKAQDVSGVVLDLRDNPGGEVDASIDVASLWLTPGQRVMQEKRGDRVLREYNATAVNTLSGVPTIILINEGSASASEIVAGALRDQKAATVLGERSYGKGVVQGLEDLRGGAQLKVTIASWFRPNGQNIDKKGVTPDQTVKRSTDDIKADRDPQLDAAVNRLKR